MELQVLPEFEEIFQKMKRMRGKVVFDTFINPNPIYSTFQKKQSDFFKLGETIGNGTEKCVAILATNGCFEYIFKRIENK